MKSESDDRMQKSLSSRLAELARFYLKLGSIGFGGPAATIAMMEDEVVQRKRWISRAEFLDYLAATNLIPGPNSTEMAIHIGSRRAGWPGLIVAGSCFIFPAAFIVWILAWAYVNYGRLPQAAGFLYGVKPVVLAIIVQAVWRLGRSALKTKILMAAGIITAILSFLGVNELAVLFGAGFAVALLRWAMSRKGKPPVSISGCFPGLGMAASAAANALPAVSVVCGRCFCFS